MDNMASKYVTNNASGLEKVNMIFKGSKICYYMFMENGYTCIFQNDLCCMDIYFIWYNFVNIRPRWPDPVLAN